MYRFYIVRGGCMLLRVLWICVYEKTGEEVFGIRGFSPSKWV